MRERNRHLPARGGKVFEVNYMTDCKNLIIKDITPWHGDVFDHPVYEYTCKLTKRKVVPCFSCKSKCCKNYEPVVEKKND